MVHVFNPSISIPNWLFILGRSCKDNLGHPVFLFAAWASWWLVQQTTKVSYCVYINTPPHTRASAMHFMVHLPFVLIVSIIPIYAFITFTFSNWAPNFTIIVCFAISYWCSRPVLMYIACRSWDRIYNLYIVIVIPFYPKICKPCCICFDFFFFRTICFGEHFSTVLTLCKRKTITKMLADLLFHVI